MSRTDHFTATSESEELAVAIALLLFERLATFLIKESEVFGDVLLLKYCQYFYANNLLLL